MHLWWRRKLRQAGSLVETISVELDQEIVDLLGTFEQPVSETVREILVLDLYRRTIISAGKGAALLHMPLLEFIQHSGRLGIPYFKMAPEEFATEGKK